MSYIELLDEQIVNFYRSHNYWWPDEIVMSQNTMDKLKQEVRDKGFCNWKGNKFNYVSLKISNEVEDDKFVLVGAPELRHHKCSFCGIVLMCRGISWMMDFCARIAIEWLTWDWKWTLWRAVQEWTSITNI